MNKSVLRAIRTAACLGTALSTLPALAQSATWIGLTSDYDQNTNWSPNLVPTDEAAFDSTGASTVIITVSPQINSILFRPSAQQYRFTNNGTYLVDGSGVTNRSAFTQTFTNAGTLTFGNGALVVGGSSGFLLVNSNPGGSAAQLDFSASSGIDLNTTLENSGGDAVAVGGAVFESNSTTTFNDNATADAATIRNLSGDASAIGSGGGAFAFGGSATLTFLNNAHASGAVFELNGGNATATANAAGSFANAGGGFSLVSFLDAAHANGALFEIAGGTTAAIGGAGGSGAIDGGTAFASGGFAGVEFLGTSSADGATFNNLGSTISATGGAGAAGDLSFGPGGNGGEATAFGGFRSIAFSDSSHADGTTITNTSGPVNATGGAGGAGDDVEPGGAGGAATALGQLSDVTIEEAAHINNAVIRNIASTATTVGGAGGDGGIAGVGGAGGAALADGGEAQVTFFADNLGLGGASSNIAGSAFATGGAGGDASGAGAAGAGGDATSNAGPAYLFFFGSSSAGTAVITNASGDATAIGGTGGGGGTGAGGAGGAAFATGGDAQVDFFESSTAGSATIVNTAGTSSATVGAAGAPGSAGGAGGAGGTATATAGTAIVNFSDTSTAGQATITNNSGAFTVFRETSTGGTARLTNNGGETLFIETSSAQGATITNSATGTTRFSDGATAGGATLANAGLVQFNDTSLGGNATIQNNAAGVLDIRDSADLVGASVTNALAATIHIGSTAAGTRIGSLSGSGNVVLGARSLELGALNRNDIFAGVISGTGSLTKVGTGTLVLSGINTYSGATIVGAGTLQVDGRIASATSIAAPATLTGVGTIAGNVVNDGTVSAGTAAAPFGTLTVSGNFTSNAGSFFVSNIHPAGTSDLLSASTTTLNGGTVRAVAASGLYPVQTDFRILGTTGGRTGTFSALDESALPTFLDASLVYTASDVILRVRRTATGFALSPGLTPNQAAVALVMDQAVVAGNPLVFSTFAPLFNALLLAPDQLAANLGLVSGDALTVYPMVELGAGERFNDRMNMEGSDLAGRRLNLWGTVSRSNDEIDDDFNGPRADARSTDFQIGFGFQAGPNTVVGISAGRGNSNVDINARFASGDVRTTSVGAYFRHGIGGFYAAGEFSYSWHDIDSERALPAGVLATGSYDAKTLAATGELGLSIMQGDFSVEPHVRLKYLRSKQDVFGETGGAGALTVDADAYKNSRVGLGVRVANVNPNLGMRPYGFIAYERALSDDQVALTNTLPGLGSFRVVSTELGRDIVSARLGVAAQVGAVSLFTAVGASIRDNAFSQYALGGLKLSW